MSTTMIGLDTAKSVFQVHAVNEAGQVEVRRKLRRCEVVPFFEGREACTVVLEACAAAHHWARVLTGLGHEVKLIGPWQRFAPKPHTSAFECLLMLRRAAR